MKSKHLLYKRMFYTVLVFSSLSLFSAGFASFNIVGGHNTSVEGNINVGDIIDMTNYVGVNSYSLTPYCQYGFEDGNGGYSNQAKFSITMQAKTTIYANTKFNIVLENKNTGAYTDLSSFCSNASIDGNIANISNIESSADKLSLILTLNQQLSVTSLFPTLNYELVFSDFNTTYTYLAQEGLSFNLLIYTYVEGGNN